MFCLGDQIFGLTFFYDPRETRENKAEMACLQVQDHAEPQGQEDPQDQQATPESQDLL